MKRYKVLNFYHTEYVVDLNCRRYVACFHGDGIDLFHDNAHGRVFGCCSKCETIDMGKWYWCPLFANTTCVYIIANWISVNHFGEIRPRISEML